MWPWTSLGDEKQELLEKYWVEMAKTQSGSYNEIEVKEAQKLIEQILVEMDDNYAKTMGVECPHGRSQRNCQDPDCANLYIVSQVLES